MHTHTHTHTHAHTHTHTHSGSDAMKNVIGLAVRACVPLGPDATPLSDVEANKLRNQARTRAPCALTRVSVCAVSVTCL